MDEIEKKGFIALPNRGPQQAPALKTVCPNLEKIVRGLMAVFLRGHDQLVDCLLMDQPSSPGGLGST